MSSDINVQTFSGKVNINNNLLVGSSHFFVDTVNNKVGITTSDPQASLDVNGDVNVGTNLTLGGILTGDGSGLTNVNSDSGLWAGAGTGSVYLSTSTDNVGIGTTSPQYKLDVGNGGGDVMLRVMDQTASSGKLIFGRSGNTEIRSHAIESYNSSGSQNNYMKFLVHDGTGTSPYETRTEVMTLLGNGHVGIGDTNPGHKFVVKSGSLDEITTFKIETQGSITIARNHNSSPFISSNMSSGHPKWNLGNVTTTRTSINGGSNQNSYFNTGGNVGIGTTSPVTSLDLGDLGGGSIRLGRDHDGDNTSTNRIGRTGVGNTIWYSSINFEDEGTNDDAIAFVTHESGVGQFERMRISGNGNVGIGTTNTGTHGAKLLVNGTMGTYMSGGSVANRFYVYNQHFASPVVNQIHLALRNYNDTAPSQTQADRKSGFWFGQYNDQNYTDGEQFIGFTNSIRFIKCDPNDYAGYIYYDSNTFNARINGNLQSRIGSIDSSSTSNPINFTGQHRCVVENFNTNLEGLIVSANKSEYCSMSGGLNRGLQAVTINEALPIVTLSRTCMDKTCFGVISLSEDPENETREDRFGCFVAEFEKEEGDERVYINSVGEGAIWVTNINGPLKSGDYITTSTVPGYGQIQNDDILHNYTVAKITMNCDFEPNFQNVKKIKKVLTKEKLWCKIENTEIDDKEYLTISDEKKFTFVEDGKTKYMKTIKRYSKEKREEYDLEEVVEIMKNVLDENGQIQWENDPSGATEKAYKTRYLLPDGTQISEEEYTTRALSNEEVYIAAFVGCTYHCG
jgi:hypothetical protein